jgi:acyl dehydratase
MSLPTLTAHHVKARNTASASENKIHDDAVARKYGFRGGLVPGVTVYAYATAPLVAALGAAWLERGTASVRFVKPVLDGEDVIVSGSVAPGAGGLVTATLTVLNPAGEECAAMTATLPQQAAAAPDAGSYAMAPLPRERPAAAREHLAVGAVLGTPEVVYDEACAAAYLEGVSDTQPLYRGPGAFVHPAFYLHEANRALRDNVLMGPWIHTGSLVTHLGGARLGERLATRGRVAKLYDRKGREMVELDLLVVAGVCARPVALVRHTAIWKLPEAPPA